MSWEAWGSGEEFFDDWPEKATEAGWYNPDDLPKAAIDVIEERQRQRDDEGWTEEHDDQHIRGELGAAAACYAVPSRERMHAFNLFWPVSWAKSWFKPSGAHDDLNARRRDLVKSGALVIAEIERIDRILGRRAVNS